MKKRVFALFIFAIFLSIYAVHAADYYSTPSVRSTSYNFPINDLGQTARNFMGILEDSLGPVFEGILGVPNMDQYFFARVLLLILIYVIVVMALAKIEIFSKNKGVRVIIAIIVAILASRYMAEFKFIEGALLPYGALGIALVVGLPFLIYFFFVHGSISSGVGRRLAWIVFAIVFFSLWMTRTNEIGDYNWIYGIGILVVIITVMFDGKIHEYFGIYESSKIKKERIKQQLADIEARLHQYSAIPTPSQNVKEVIRKLEERHKELAKRL